MTSAKRSMKFYLLRPIASPGSTADDESTEAGSDCRSSTGRRVLDRNRARGQAVGTSECPQVRLRSGFTPSDLVPANDNIDQLQQVCPLQPIQRDCARRGHHDGRLPSPCARLLKHGSPSSSWHGFLVRKPQSGEVLRGQFLHGTRQSVPLLEQFHNLPERRSIRTPEIPPRFPGPRIPIGTRNRPPSTQRRYRRACRRGRQKAPEPD